MSLMGNYARAPVRFARGAGCSLWDEDGIEYLDLVAGIAVCSIGHAHPRLVAAVQEQAATLMHTSNLFEVPLQESLAARLAPPGGAVFFCNSGAEAVEAAIKLARKRRTGGSIVVAQGAFHGRTYGALSATPQEAKQAPFAPLVPGFRPVHASALAAAVDGGTAAVLVEPIQGESGVHPLDPQILRAVRAACDEHGALLILDEVQTGIGRTGSLYAFEQMGVRPDAWTLAKGLGGGVPIGALVVQAEHSEILVPGDHGTTFGGNPLSCAAAHAVLDVVDDPGFLDAVHRIGERLREGLRELPHVTDVRGRGLMTGFDLEGVSAPALVTRALSEQRLVVNATGPATIRLVPPLIITEAEVDDALGRLGALLG